METYDLLQCIDRVLDEFGSSAKQAVYLNLALRKGIPHEAMLENPEAFASTLQEVFDESSNVVKRAISREIKSTLGIDALLDPQYFEETIELACRGITGNVYTIR